ncbi:hypothetical protein E3N88_44477 [Mikania micrantha]|uniref:Uncharacterized protein n=1 Tax=Mikania micrantha TaxID=192012 RepID=A0A5N6LBX1_9ASTR|nr:hypothetical protein E3N88_44477 [Mikania micrantha]
MARLWGRPAPMAFNYWYPPIYTFCTKSKVTGTDTTFLLSPPQAKIDKNHANDARQAPMIRKKATAGGPGCARPRVIVPCDGPPLGRPARKWCRARAAWPGHGASLDRGSKATLPLTIPRHVFKSSAKDSTRRLIRIVIQDSPHDSSIAQAKPMTRAFGGQGPYCWSANRRRAHALHLARILT